MTSVAGAAGDLVAAVTGGASGLGRAIAARCAQHGMRVALLDLDGDRASAEAAALADEHSVEAFGAPVDCGNAESVSAGAAAVSQRFGRADVVVSNVGVQLFGAVERLTDDEWRWVLDVNVVGAARVARAFLPLLRHAAPGRLAFVSSASVLAPASRLGAYQASKFALWGLADTLRLELADDPVTVTVVFPSGMVSRHLETSEAAQPDHVRRAIAEPDDFAAMQASNPGMVADVAMPDEAAAAAYDGIVAGAHYVVTHGDVTEGLAARDAELAQAAARARDAGSPA